MRFSRCCPLTLSFCSRSPTRCYFFLVFWIVSFTTGLYWLLAELGHKKTAIALSHQGLAVLSGGNNDELNDFSHNALEVDDYPPLREHSAEHETLPTTKPDLYGARPFVKISDVERLCNRRELITQKDEYFHHPDFKLDAVIIIFRHGDRGPLSHLGNLNLSSVNCNDTHPEYMDLIKFVTDLSKVPGYAQFIGPFHSFPRVPSDGTACSLGQLTSTGVIQLMTLGKLVRSTYESSGLFGNGSLSSVKITAYSTRYRRTFQSLLSFLFGLLGPHAVVPSVTITESQSTAFCFTHCSCKAAERLKKDAMKASPALKHEKQTMTKLVSDFNSLLELGKVKKSGASILDSLLVYACHRSPLPCRRRRQWKSPVKDCVTMDKLQNLIDLIELDNERLKNTPKYRQHALLISYGLLKEILNLALRMTSSGPPTAGEPIRSRLAVLSGHDKTLQGLLDALGIDGGHRDLNLLPYASRLIIEIYRWRTLPEISPRKHFLRFVYNGEDITQLIDFCSETTFASRDTTSGRNVDLCSMESLVRFFHDTYFDAFPKGVVNFKDACRL